MSHRHDVVIEKSVQEQRTVPDRLKEYALVVIQLFTNGLLDEISERLRIYRRGGYSAIDGILFLLGYFCSGCHEGLKGFDEDVAPYRSRMAALGGRKSLPTQASMSRLLEAVESKSLDEFGPWLLLDASGMSEVLGHPMMALHDTNGHPCHVFDLDGSDTLFRRRSLPQNPQMPEARRDIDGDLARPGYSGRKRGEVQLCRSTLAHLGSSAWLGVWLHPGNEDITEVPARAAELVAESARKSGIEPSQCILRGDGLYGNWGFVEVCHRAGIHYLVRWKSYELLNDPRVRQRLEEAQWHLVESSQSGPTRYATELGVSTSPKSGDGGSLSTRVVASRYLDTGREGAGVVIDGYRYELYGTSLLQEDFPAAQSVALYYGRVAVENRFSQEDREHQLDRLFSTNPGGQHLAILVGLFLWNMRIRRGLDLAKQELDKQSLPAPVTRKDTVESENGLDTLRQFEDTPVNPARQLIDELGLLDWDSLLERRKHWSWSTHGLLCPAGKTTPLKRVVPSRKGYALLFRARVGECMSCPRRAQCMKSSKPSHRKEMQVAVGPKEGEKLSWLKALSLPSTWREPETSQPVEVAGFQLPRDIKSGPYEISGPHIIPSTLRHHFRKQCRRLVVLVELSILPTKKTPECFAATNGERQRRRLTWQQRIAWNQLPSDAKVRITFLAPDRNEVKLLLDAGGKKKPRISKAA